MTLRAWLAMIAIALLFWVLFLGSLVAAGAFGSCHSHRVHRRHERHWIRTHIWRYRWAHLSGWERTWARCVANAETRGIAWASKATAATGNGYYGAVQWLPSTWRMAGGSGLPTQHSLYEQLVRAVWWAHRESPRQWSTSKGCGW